VTTVVVLVALVLTVGVIALARAHRHVEHLEFLLAEAAHGGDARNLWDYPCQHCKRRLRGEATRSYTDVVKLPGGGTRTTTMAFHSCRPKCAAAANRYAVNLPDIDQHQEEQ
jgi:hypothetical protein